MNKVYICKHQTKHGMLIGTLAQKTGFSRDTIRYYEKIGLIAPANLNRQSNNYKDYAEYLVDRLAFIKQVKQYGFSLEEINELLSLWDDGVLTCDDVENRVIVKKQDIEARIRCLQNIHERLSQLSQGEKCTGNYCSLEFRDH